MASPQLENGYFKIANEIAEALTRTNLSAYQSRILWAILRKTYGFNKKEDWVSYSQLAHLTGLRKQHIFRTLKELKDRNLVTKGGYFVGFNKDYQQWRELPKGVTTHHKVTKGGYTVTKGGYKSNLRGGPQNKTIIQKTIKRDPSNPAVKDFFGFWDKAFREKTGRDYFFTGGKEGSLTKKMLASYSLDRLKELAGVFFKSQDQFFLNSGYTIGFFYSQINKVVIEAEKVKSSAVASDSLEVKTLAKLRERAAIQAVPCPAGLKPDFLREVES